MAFDSAPVAKYYRVGHYLEQQIMQGAFAPNQQLPTEARLTERFKVSRGTIRKAIDMLERQGLVRREQGRGTFVNDPSEQGIAGFVLSDFGAEMRGQPAARVLKQTVVDASDTVAARLEIAPGDPVIHIQRLRLANEQPIVFEERFLNAQLCPQLVDDDVVTQSIHWLLIHKYKLPLVRVTHTVEMRAAGESAQLLRLASGDQVFAVDRLTYTRQDDAILPAVNYRAVYRGDQYQFKAQFNTMI